MLWTSTNTENALQVNVEFPLAKAQGWFVSWEFSLSNFLPPYVSALTSVLSAPIPGTSVLSTPGPRTSVSRYSHSLLSGFVYFPQ